MTHLVPWLLTVQVIGLAAVPWSFLLFRFLPDRGYGVSKPLGLLIVVYAYWAVVTAGVLPNGPLSLVVILTLFLGASALLLRSQLQEIRFFLRFNRRVLVFEEVVFIAAFSALVLYRVLFPDVTVTTAVTGLTTEQPMDLAFLASSIRSPEFPVADPWLAGHSISYYYLGYLTLSLPAQLSFAPPWIAYNLGLATIFGLAAIASFSLAANAITLANLRGVASTRFTGIAYFGGGLAAALLLVAGNLSGGWQAVRRLVPFGDVGLLDDPNWWFWPTRIIIDGTHADPIDEFPAFSFVLGDLHPHLMAIPFVLLALTLALAWLARRDPPDYRWPIDQPGEAVLIALVIGALGFLNTWDLPAYLLVFMASVAILRLWRASEEFRDSPARWGRVTGDILGPSLAVAALSILLYLPFYGGIDAPARGLLPVAETGTNWGHYVQIWGPLFFGVPMAFVVFWSRLGAGRLTGTSIAIVIGVGAAPLAAWTIIAALWTSLLFDVPPPPEEAGFMVRRWLIVLPVAALFIAGIGALWPSRWERMPATGMAFALLLVVAGAFAVMIPELFFVRDAFGTRMNTVFKMHYQAWIVFSVAGGIGAAWLLTRPRPLNVGIAGVSLLGVVIGAIFVLASLVYGPAATWTRASTSDGASVALDGLSKYAAEFPDEASAVRWLRRNAYRDSVLLEAVGTVQRFDYSDFSRVSAITGIPTVLGWQGHEAQWRSSPYTYLGRREAADTIFDASDPNESRRLIDLYDVDYIFVGRLEIERYGPNVATRLAAAIPDAEVNRWGEVSVLDIRPK